jgi:hypothetical protein
VVYGPGTPGVFPSGISTLQQRADSVQSWYDNQNFDCQQVVLSINEIEEVDFILYPNPSSGIFNVEFDESLASVSTTVYDMTGRIVHTEKHSNANQCTIDLSEHSGVFILVIESPSGTATKRLIVE